MTFEVIITPEAARDLIRLAKSEPKAYAKVQQFVKELQEHPKTGTGHPEPLKGKPEGRWSRETEVYIDVLSAYGHYDDK